MDEPGEEVLLWQQRNREEADKLISIENKLKSLSEAVQQEVVGSLRQMHLLTFLNSKIESPKLTDEQLCELLDQCNRTISHSESSTRSRLQIL